MAEQGEPLEGIAREVEIQLRDLRRLIAEDDELTKEQNILLNSIKELLYKVHTQTVDLKHSLVTGLPPINVFYATEEKPVTNTATLQTKAERELEELWRRLRPNTTEEGNPEKGLEGGNGVPSVPVRPTPVRDGGAAKTFAEAEEPPRNA